MTGDLIAFSEDDSRLEARWLFVKDMGLRSPILQHPTVKPLTMIGGPIPLLLRLT